MTSRRGKLKELWFFIIPICTCVNSVRKMLGNQIVFTPPIKFIPFSKYLSFHLGAVLVHANWANLDRGINSHVKLTENSLYHGGQHTIAFHTRAVGNQRP